jgi:hypothetical protein
MVLDVFGTSLLCLAVVGVLAIAAVVFKSVHRLIVVGVAGIMMLLALAALFLVSSDQPGRGVAAWSRTITFPGRVQQRSDRAGQSANRAASKCCGSASGNAWAHGEDRGRWSATTAASGGAVRLKDVKTLGDRTKRWSRDLWRRAPKLRGTGVVGTVVAALALAGFLYVGYVFLDGSTRGHFTWSLRLLSIMAFAALCLLTAIVRHGR